MKAAYIGTLTPGSTSLMRAERVRELTPWFEWSWVDTDSVILESDRVWQSVAYRLQSGKAVQQVNATILSAVASRWYDLIWVDKAIFLLPNTVRMLRGVSRRLIHFTPDTAFANGRSRHFEKTLSLYDLLVTTKPFDVPEYLELAGKDIVHLTTQGFDPSVHYPRNPDAMRRPEVVFVGLAEKDRARCISVLLDHDITVRLSGLGWDSFLRQYRGNGRLVYEGAGVFGNAYAKILSEAWIGLGLLSKRFPELHTTRTFEIPACGAVLATEPTAETTRFLKPDEALFFQTHEELAERVEMLLSEPGYKTLSGIANRGRARVTGDRRGYQDILASVLADPRLSG